MLDAFGWSLPMPGDIYDILTFSFVGHPFHGVKKVLWWDLLGLFLKFCGFLDLVVLHTAKVYLLTSP